MAYTEQTTHYGLPLPTAGDKSTFLDTNESFERVDSALYGAATDASAAYNKSIEIALESHELKRSVIELSDKIDTMRADVNLNTTNIVATMEDVDILQTDTNKLKLDVNDLIVSRLPEIDEKIEKKIDTFSGEVTDADDEQYTAKTADAIAYDETNGQLLLKVDGADTVIPFSRGGSGGTVKGYHIPKEAMILMVGGTGHAKGSAWYWNLEDVDTIYPVLLTNNPPIFAEQNIIDKAVGQGTGWATFRLAQVGWYAMYDERTNKTRQVVRWYNSEVSDSNVVYYNETALPIAYYGDVEPTEYPLYE